MKKVERCHAQLLLCFESLKGNVIFSAILFQGRVTTGPSGSIASRFPDKFDICQVFGMRN